MSVSNNSAGRRRVQGILIGLLIALLLLAFLFGFLLFGPTGSVFSFFDVVIPVDMTDGSPASPPTCQRVLTMQDGLNDSLYDVLFNLFFWINNTRSAVGAPTLCGGNVPTITGGTCNQRCDPNGSTCDPGLSCQREPDGGYVCWGGTDSAGDTCGNPPRPSGGACNAPCDPANPTCDPGLSCVTEPDGGYVCWGGTDASGETCAFQQNQPSQPSTSDQTCSCSFADYICTKPDGSQTVSYNSTVCGGSGNCECRGTDWACPNGYYSVNDPECHGGQPQPTCTCVKADPQCNPLTSGCKYVCQETGASCTP